MPQKLVNSPPKNLFFTGKGGVGKTTTSAATAITLADSGKRVLLVSTDPASNLDEVLGVALSSQPVQVPGVQGLFALNVDPEQAAAAYREVLVGPYRGILPEAAVRSMEEQLSGACTVEIAAFNEFATLIGDPSAVAGFDHIIFDCNTLLHCLPMCPLERTPMSASPSVRISMAFIKKFRCPPFCISCFWKGVAAPIKRSFPG